MGKKKMMSVGNVVVEKGSASTLRPVSEMLTEYGLSIRTAVPRHGDKTVPSYVHEHVLMTSLKDVVSSIEELRILGAMWIEATFPSCGHSGHDVSTVAELLYVVFDPMQSFAKSAVIKDMMQRGLIVNGENRRKYSMISNSAKPFIERSIALPESVLEHIATLDARADVDQRNEVPAELLTFTNKKQPTFDDMELSYLKRSASAITLADHFLEPELVERIHMAAHARNADVRAIMHRMGVYTGPIKREETTVNAERNVIILYGPPGTGKTSAAYALAGELGLPVLTLGVDDVLDSLWGEAEDNMRAAFEEYNKAAEVLGRRPVLLMDECDSLLLRRMRNSDNNSGISNAMANVVNVALQEIEQFRGTLIMTTNDIESIDPAFARRVDESIKLDYPSKDTQRKMWAKYLTINAPGVDSVDIELLLNAGSLTGAHIVKCVERAVKHKLITCGDSFVLSTDDFIREIQQELRSFDRSLLAKNDIKAEDVLQESRSSSFGFV